MAITLDQIKALREKTGVSTMACKKALEEAGGDEAAAIELLRKRGEAKAAERSERSTAFGVIAVSSQDGKSAMVAVGCETDFVAKNPDFVAEVQKLADKALAEGEGTDLSNEVSELGLKMGEKIELKEVKTMEADTVESYVHSNNRIGVLVGLSGSANDSVEKAKQVAMHIAAMKPEVLSPDDVDQELVDKEKGIWKEQLLSEGKPENILDKIMMGKEKKFREEVALLTQNFVMNPEQNIADLLGELNVDDFVRFEV